MYGIKGFDENLQCRGFQYEVGKTYEMDEEPILCSRGFHLCSSVRDVFTYYPKFWCDRYCVVEAVGDIDFGHVPLDGSGTLGKIAANKIRTAKENGKFEKIATNKIRIVKEITNDIRLMLSSPETIVLVNMDSANIGTFDGSNIHVSAWMTMHMTLTYTGVLEGIINKIIKDDELRKENK